MKQIFIVLLVAAVGAGVYFYLSKKQNSSSANSKELILGKWKVDSFQLSKDDTLRDLEKTNITLDSTYSKFTYSFDSTGIVLKQLNDSVKADTDFYKWIKADKLVWSRWEKDSVMKPLLVVKLDSANLILQSADKGEIFFSRVQK